MVAAGARARSKAAQNSKVVFSMECLLKSDVENRHLYWVIDFLARIIGPSPISGYPLACTVGSSSAMTAKNTREAGGLPLLLVLLKFVLVKDCYDLSKAKSE
jgi:hypothetical protein